MSNPAQDVGFLLQIDEFVAMALPLWVIELLEHLLLLDQLVSIPPNCPKIASSYLLCQVND